MKKSLGISAIAAVFMIILMRWQGAALITTVTPRGILNLEFAKTVQDLKSLLAVWTLADVRMNIWLDFAFIVTYVVFLSSACLFFSEKSKKPGMTQLGIWMARLTYVAGVLDIAENLLMLQSISGSYHSLSISLTAIIAFCKFLLAGVVIIYLIFSIPKLFNQPNQ